MKKVARELWVFLRDHKRLWLVPMIIVLGLFGVMVLLTRNSAANFVYNVFG